MHRLFNKLPTINQDSSNNCWSPCIEIKTKNLGFTDFAFVKLMFQYGDFRW